MAFRGPRLASGHSREAPYRAPFQCEHVVPAVLQWGPELVERVFTSQCREQHSGQREQQMQSPGDRKRLGELSNMGGAGGRGRGQAEKLRPWSRQGRESKGVHQEFLFRVIGGTGITREWGPHPLCNIRLTREAHGRGWPWPADQGRDSFFLFPLIILFVCFWLCWVLIAA